MASGITEFPPFPFLLAPKVLASPELVPMGPPSLRVHLKQAAQVNPPPPRQGSTMRLVQPRMYDTGWWGLGWNPKDTQEQSPSSITHNRASLKQKGIQEGYPASQSVFPVPDPPIDEFYFFCSLPKGGWMVTDFLIFLGGAKNGQEWMKIGLASSNFG